MDNVEIDAQLNDGVLTVSATQFSGYTYQYWIRQKVLTDSAQNTYGLIWQMKRDYGESTAEIELAEADYDETTLFEVMVRVKNSKDEYYGQIYKVFDLNDLKVPYITNIVIDGKTIYNEIPFIEAASVTNFKVLTNIDAMSYKIYLNNDETPIAESDSDKLNFVSFSGIKVGYHTLTFVAENEGFSAEKTIQIYIYDIFLSAEQPKISSLEGTSNINGLTSFSMTLAYVNDEPISILEKDKFEYRLSIQGKEYVSTEQKIVDGHLVAQFTVDLNHNSVALPLGDTPINNIKKCIKNC